MTPAGRERAWLTAQFIACVVASWLAVWGLWWLLVGLWGMWW